MKLAPTLTLPQNYSLLKRLDIREKKSLVTINLWGVVLLIAAWFVFTRLALWIRPEMGDHPLSFNMQGILGALSLLGMLLGVTVVMLVVHEALHGVCFWAYTKTRPRFAFKGYYAYAAAPQWYLPRGKYLVTALAPLVGITFICLVMIAFIALSWIPALLWMLLFNTSGAVGDLWVVTALLCSPAESYVRDAGDLVEIYTPAK